MLISELIEKLTMIRNEKGDTTVMFVVKCPDGEFFGIHDVETGKLGQALLIHDPWAAEREA